MPHFCIELAPYATHVKHSKGRLIPEPEYKGRSIFQRDRERLIHARAFRRLKHKTQVFIAAEGDHYRSRLTHSLEVSQIARALARLLHIDEDLTETIALAHDLGHPPFGHVGENALNEVMKNYGGFEHNAQALHIVTTLEERYPAFKGLNLSWESLEGIVKHNGPLIGPQAPLKSLSARIAAFDKIYPLSLSKYSSLEAQCAAIADDIAYNAHDIDDGLRAGILTLDMLHEPEISCNLLTTIKKDYPNIDNKHCACELARRQISLMIEDVIETTNEQINKLQPKTVEDIYNAEQTIVKFSPIMHKKEQELKRFLYKNLYYHESLMPKKKEAETIIKTLFDIYMNDINLLPFAIVQPDNETLRAQHICDFLSGMTDNYAQQIYAHFTS